MGNAAEQLTPSKNLLKSVTSSFSDADSIHTTLNKRQSQEIVIALCGPIGSGIQSVEEQLESVLRDEQYDIHRIRVSHEIEEFYSDCGHALVYDASNKANRYNALMDTGNELRTKHGDAACAALAIAKIAIIREGFTDENAEDNFIVGKKTALKRRAYIINQLKHPDEVKALKSVYGNLFYVVGVLCNEARRKVSICDEGIGEKEAHDLIERDKNEVSGHGQQLEKTLFHADYFINNSDPNASSARSLLDRFLKLVHGGRGITPTREESGMYAAHSASLQSGCLSRQVGASIMTKEGIVIAVGHNDVPKFGGGLYTEDDNITPHTKDYRCVHRDQRCHNDLHKLKLRDKIAELLTLKLKDSNPDINFEDVADSLYHDSQIKSLIEYSRAIHAEMDAIISLARTGVAVPDNSTLFTTTFPCHNCARHIITAGISKIIYIEPYEKSLAISLHDDALSHSHEKNKVLLAPFQGVAPSRYQVFYGSTTPKKGTDGRIIVSDRGDLLQVDSSYVDNYLERESLVASEILIKRSPQD